MPEGIENPYESIIQQLQQKAGQHVTIKVKFPDSTIGSYSGVLAIIRYDSCLLYDANKEGISIQYCIIQEIK